MAVAGNIATWFLVFLTYSVLGWALEMVAVTFMMHRKVTNRGFLIGPVCPIYGFGAIFMTLLLRNVNNLVAIFVVAVLGSALLEYFTSYAMEKLFRVRWWDYTEKPFNIRGRICLENLFYFGVMGILVVKLINPVLFGFFEAITLKPRIAIAGVLLAVMVADIALSLWLIIVCRVTVGTVESDATEEITEHVREILMDKGKLNRRLVKAFPEMQAKKHTPRKKKSNKTTKSSKAMPTKSTSKTSAPANCESTKSSS